VLLVFEWKMNANSSTRRWAQDGDIFKRPVFRGVVVGSVGQIRGDALDVARTEVEEGIGIEGGDIHLPLLLLMTMSEVIPRMW
jgi:hypothetical protein